MDTGTFRRSRIEVLSWLLGPLLLIALLNYIVVSYAHLIDRELTREHQLAEVIPKIERRVAEAEKLTDSFSRLPDGRIRTATQVTALFNERAAEYNFVIHSVSTSRAQERPGTLTIYVRGEAVLVDFIACLDGLQRDDQLFNAALSDLRIVSLYPEPRYAGKFVLTFRGLASFAPSRVATKGGRGYPDQSKGQSGEAS